MKHKLKKILCLSIFSILFVMNSCQKEENDDFELQNIKVYHKSFNEIIKESSFKANYDKLNKVKKEIAKNTSRTVMEQQYNFTIVEREANVIVNDSMTSYTLLIERETKLDNEFENLVIVVPNNSVFQPTAYIFKVTSNTPFVENPYNTSTFIGERIVTPITLDLTQIVNSLNMPPDMCHTYQEWICTGNLHHTTSVGCTSGYSRTWTVCGNGGLGGGSGSAGGNTGSGDETQQEIYEGPVVHIATVTPEINSINPCEKLKNSIKIPLIRTKVNELITDLNNSTVEKGYQFNINSSGVVTANPQLTSTVNTCSFRPTTNSFGSAHLHQPNSPTPGESSENIPMIDPGDLQALCSYTSFYGADNSQINQEAPAFFVMIIVNGTIYAAMPNDPNEFSGYQSYFFDKEAVKELNNRIGKKWSQNVLVFGQDNALANKDALAREFLKFINNVDNINPDLPNFNISLYKINSTTASLDTGTWSKIELDNTKPNGVSITPCN